MLIFTMIINIVIIINMILLIIMIIIIGLLGLEAAKAVYDLGQDSHANIYIYI